MTVLKRNTAYRPIPLMRIMKFLNKYKYGKERGDGFTLIEIIVTVLIVAILGSMVIVFLSSSFIKSSDPVLRLQKSTDLKRVMANMTADYKKYPVWQKNPHTYQGDDIVIPTPYSTIGQKYYYKCTTPAPGGGSVASGNCEPSWKGCNTFTDGVTVPDGAIIWTCGGKLQTLDELYTKIGSVDSTTKKYNYGHTGIDCSSDTDCPSGAKCDSSMCKTGYYVIENGYIKFDASNVEQQVTSSDILKVTIKNDTGEMLSALFF